MIAKLLVLTFCAILVVHFCRLAAVRCRIGSDHRCFLAQLEIQLCDRHPGMQSIKLLLLCIYFI